MLEVSYTSSAISSADSNSPLNLSAESSREEALDPKKTAAPPKSRLERKKGKGKRKRARKVNDAEDGDGDGHFRRAYDKLTFLDIICLYLRKQTVLTVFPCEEKR